MPERLEVARVIKPHGIRGAVVMHCSQDHVDRMCELDAYTLEFPNGESTTLSVESASGSGVGLRVKFAGIDDRNAAELLRNATVLVERDELDELHEDEFFHSDLAGLRVVRHGDNREIGDVKSVRSFPANDVLEIVWKNGATIGGATDMFVPFIREAVPHVDIPGGSITVDTDFLGVSVDDGDA